jgi:hypothetical protein
VALAVGCVDEDTPSSRVCTSSADCTDGDECVTGPAAEDDTPVCRAAVTEAGACCFGDASDGTCAGTAADVLTLTADTDGCAAGLVCVGEVTTGVDGSPQDPICVHEADRGEGERCNVGADECADGLVCAFAEGVCRARECSADADCDGDEVCVQGAAEACASSCGPPAALGSACFVDADEQCGLVHSCADGLDCVDGSCAEPQTP